MEQENPEYQVIPLGELQWWSLEVISGTIIGVGVGVFAGASDLGLPVTFLVAGLALLAIFIVGALLRRVSHTRSLYIDAPPEKVFDTLLTYAGRGALLRSLWGIVLTVERPPERLRPGATIKTSYQVGGSALSMSGARKGDLTITVAELERPHKLVQHVSNKFRGRTTRGTGETVLEPHNGGTRVTERTSLIMPLSASHFIGAIYSRMVLSRSSRTFLMLLKRTSEGSRT